MIVVTPGHTYHLANVDHGYQSIHFMHKKVDEIGNLVTIENGTTNEEVILALLNRMHYLNSLQPCGENRSAIFHLEEALAALDARTRKHQALAVEGTPKVHESEE